MTFGSTLSFFFKAVLIRARTFHRCRNNGRRSSLGFMNDLAALKDAHISQERLPRPKWREVGGRRHYLVISCSEDRGEEESHDTRWF